MSELITKNIWDFEQLYFSTNDIDMLFINNDIKIFSCKDGYNYSEEPQTILETRARQNGYNFKYTDSNHNIVIAKNPMIFSYVNRDFFTANKDLFIKKAKEVFYKKIETDNSVSIPEYILDQEILNYLLKLDTSKKDYSITIYEYVDKAMIPSDILDALKKKHFDLSIYHLDGEKDVISHKNVIGYYSEKDLLENNEISVILPLTDREISNFSLIKPGTIIDFNYFEQNEEFFYSDLSYLLDQLSKQGKEYNIKFRVYNRNLLKKKWFIR